MIADAEDLVHDWESIRQGYFPGEPDATLLECVEQLRVARAAVPRDPDVAAFFTLGLVLMYGHAMEADPEVADEAAKALLAAASDPAVVNRACGHETHPCDDSDVDGQLESFEMLLSLLAGDSEYEWEDLDRKGQEPQEESRWRCPHNVAGFARWAAAAIG
ncbi:hypothetical protein J7E88_12020 [Streptomyces sp. ISL-10]|uniref:hypothetical protein n=1 Tax=Streptomyces sp. ISL-10 TaxID=2819172 RepID=UPI001BEC72AA|nr:hypothetical protein [Streptomyces sp. ISL-10]MBT2366014.1 hypothetical protein [Streptomyces sp. ISL-10]